MSFFDSIKTGFSKTNQYINEKIGRAKPSTFDNDFLAMERRVLATEKLVNELIASVEKFLCPNPAVRAKVRAVSIMSRVTKRHRDVKNAQMLPEAKIGKVMTAHLEDFGSNKNSPFRNALECTGEAFKTLADLRHGLENHISQNFIHPLSLTRKDISEIHHLRSKLEGHRLDFDGRKRKEIAGDAASAEQVKKAQEKFEQSKKLTREAMQNFIERDTERIMALRGLKDEMLQFFDASSGIMSKLDEMVPAPSRSGRSAKSTVSTTAVAPSTADAWGDEHTYKPRNVVIPAAPPPAPPAEAEVEAKVIYYRALYDCVPGEDEQHSLEFKEADIIQYIETSDDKQWFYGSIQGRKGYVPFNYVQIIEEMNGSSS